MYTAMKSIFEDKNRQEALFFNGPGSDLEVQYLLETALLLTLCLGFLTCRLRRVGYFSICARSTA